MLELGKLPRDCPEVTDSDIPPLRLHGVVFGMSIIKNVLLGGATLPPHIDGKYEMRVYVDEERAPTHPHEKGVDCPIRLPQ